MEVDVGEPDYIVFRPAQDTPPGFLPAGWDGRWVDRRDTPVGPDPVAPLDDSYSRIHFVPTGRFEVRDYDGAVAEVWEIRQ